MTKVRKMNCFAEFLLNVMRGEMTRADLESLNKTMFLDLFQNLLSRFAAYCLGSSLFFSPHIGNYRLLQLWLNLVYFPSKQ